MALTILERRLVQQIISHVRRENPPIGTRLAELTLAKTMGTARTPIQAALAYLKKRGVVQHHRNRGYFLKIPASALLDLANELALTSEDNAYQRILECRMEKKIPDVVTEAELIRIVKYPRARISKALARISQEGWVERRQSQGWQFLAMIDSAEALRESIELRLLIEPQGILSPAFKPDPVALQKYLTWPRGVAGGAYESMTAMEIFNASVEFHETVASWSNNRFILQTIRRINRLRRLVLYKNLNEQLKRGVFHDHFQEHLSIVEKIAQNDYLSAATLLRDHLLRARERALMEQLATASKDAPNQ